MGRSVEKLKALQVGRISKKPGLYNDGAGLCLRVTSPTARSWVLRYMLGGKAREMGLGPYPDISLAEARAAATEARKLKAQGMDPIAARETERASLRVEAARAMTFRQSAAAYIADHKAGWKNAKHAKQWEATLDTYVYPHFGTVSVADVDVALVTKVLDPIWTTKTETAGRVRGRIEAVLDWAKAREYRKGENPARWRGHLDEIYPARSTVQVVEHHPALPYVDMAAFWTVLKQQAGLGARALQFTILTAARTEQTIKAEWSEVDFDDAVWTIPGRRMKGKRGKERDHRVPLSKAALVILRERHKATGGQGLIFPSERPKKPLSNMTMLATLRRMDRADITAHGFRSTFRDWTAETTSFPGEVAEAALAHVVGDKVEAAYRRGDLFEKRRKLMEAWGSFCTTPASAKVVMLHKASGGT